jgi:N-acetyl sugar amidotransferase
MDTTEPDIRFDENGVCHHCKEYDRKARRDLYTGEEAERRLTALVDKIKKRGEKQEYDCVLGVSGGADSTYAAYIARRHGLRLLAVHLDNGWDSELAVSNIERTLKKLDIDLYTYVVDWDEFRDLQLAYLRASVVDIEVVTDQAIRAALFDTASARGIRYVMTGANVATEGGMTVLSWGHYKNDLTNLKAIHKQFGTRELRSYPTMSLLKEAHYRYVKSIRLVSILNYVPYVKEEVRALLSRELDWVDYGHKHYESIFTRFYQGYILPRKFNVDKRKAHLSNLINSGQITREDALREIEKDPYAGQELESDREYALKKLGLAEDEFEEIMSLPVTSHFAYKTDIRWRRPLMFAYRILGG